MPPYNRSDSDSSSSSSSSSSDEEEVRPPPKFSRPSGDGGAVQKKKRVRKVVRRVAFKEPPSSTTKGLSSAQRASLIMARANANKPGRTGLSSDEDEGPALPKLPGANSDSCSDSSSEDDVVVRDLLQQDLVANAGSGRRQVSEKERAAMKEIEALRQKRKQVQRSRLNLVKPSSSNVVSAPPPPGTVSDDSDDDGDSDSDSDILPNGIEPTWIEPVALRPGLSLKKTRVWMLAMNLPSPILSTLVGIKSAELIRMCDVADQAQMIEEHGFDGAIFHLAVRQGVRQAHTEAGLSGKQIRELIKSSGGLLSSFGDVQSGSESEQAELMKDVLAKKVDVEEDDGFQIIQPKNVGRDAVGSETDSDSSDSSDDDDSDDDDDSSDSDIPLPDAPPPSASSSSSSSSPVSEQQRKMLRIHFEDGTFSAQLCLQGISAATLCQSVYDKRKMKQPDLSKHQASEFGLWDQKTKAFLPDGQCPFDKAEDLQLIFRLRSSVSDEQMEAGSSSGSDESSDESSDSSSESSSSSSDED